ncbi:MAG TPA: hypothetical protein VFQ65_30090, partial [Kofleriaceae bacterium]|nr:hypothetical protein [Kofleriaceae bacterium]
MAKIVIPEAYREASAARSPAGDGTVRRTRLGPPPVRAVATVRVAVADMPPALATTLIVPVEVAVVVTPTQL